MPDPLKALTKDLVESAYGEMIDLGPCIVSKNLNLFALRGSAPLDLLAIVSSPDVYDPEDNIGGTQRPLDPKRTIDLLEYALGAGAPTDVPRAFPEVLVNVRDTSCVQLYDPAEPSRLIDFDSWDGVRTASYKGHTIGVRVPLSILTLPKPRKLPQISRFDGNHRLSGMDQAVISPLMEGSKFRNPPFVTYSMFVNLTPDEEKRLFNTVNSKQKPVEPALLETQKYALLNEDERIRPQNLPSHLAHMLTQEEGAFNGIVFAGGSKAGAKAKKIQYILRINTVRSAMDAQLKSLSATLRAKLQADPALLATLVNNYWLAVKYMFPEAWNDKKNYILMQTIGLMALARLWGDCIVERVLKEMPGKGKNVTDFTPYLEPIREHGLLNKERKEYIGIAGAAGQERVFSILANAITDLDVLVAQAKAVHKPDEMLADQLDRA